MMNPHDDRAKIEGLLQWLHPDNPDCKLDEPKIQVVLQKVQTQILLDIRDIVYRMAQNQGIDKWGPKIATEQQFNPPRPAPPPEQPTVNVVGDKSGLLNLGKAPETE